MRKFKTAFYIVYFSFFALSIIFAYNAEIMADRENMGIAGTIRFFKYWISFGFFLYLAEWAVENVHIWNLRSKIKSLKKDNSNTRAKLEELEANQ